VVIRRTKESPLASLALSNSAGTGKTFTAFGAVKFSADQDEEQAKTEPGTVFLPSFFIVPPNIVFQYAHEFASMFEGLLTLHIWYSTVDTLPPDMRAHKHMFMGGSVEAFIDEYQALDKTDPATARHIFLTSYATLQARGRVDDSTADENDNDEEGDPTVAATPRRRTAPLIPTPSNTPSKGFRVTASDAVCRPELGTLN
jgi:hypothetical protein